MAEIKKIVYIGIYPPKAPRDKVYIDGLKDHGFEFAECVDNVQGFAKFKNVWGKLRALKGGYDLIWVGYLSGIMVPVAYLASRKKIVYNALGSAYEAYVLDRAVCGKYSFKAFLFWFSDFLAFHLASRVLVESDAQKKYLARIFLVPQQKFSVIYTGVDESIFHPDSSVQKREVFTAVFRGQFIPATGVEYVLEAAKILKDEPINFRIIGWGQLLPQVKKIISDNELDNVELITVFQEPDELRRKILECHVMLGAFSDNPRLDRTIQHKTGEALALGMPYITRDSVSNRELLTDGVDCIFVQSADAKDVAEKINDLFDENGWQASLSLGTLETYKKKLSPKALGAQLFRLIQDD